MTKKEPCSLLFFIICVSLSTLSTFAFYFISSFASLNLSCILLLSALDGTSIQARTKIDPHIHTHKNYSLYAEYKENEGKQWK